MTFFQASPLRTRGRGAVRAPGLQGGRGSARGRARAAGEGTRSLGHGTGRVWTRRRAGPRTAPRRRPGTRVRGCMPGGSVRSLEGTVGGGGGRPLGSQGLPSGKGRAGWRRGSREAGGEGGAEAVGGSPRPPLGRNWRRSPLRPRARAGRPLPTAQRPRALPLPERPAALPSQLGAAPSSAALVRAWVQQGCPPGRRQTNGQEAQGGQSRAGGLPSGLPEQQDHQCPWPG